jgi:hypothetical protein
MNPSYVIIVYCVCVWPFAYTVRKDTSREFILQLFDIGQCIVVVFVSGSARDDQ